jgi:hypothetical protein
MRHATAAAGTRHWAASWLSNARRHNIETAIELEYIETAIELE